MLIAERFWAKVDKTGECWEWTGSVSRDGYGNFALNATRLNRKVVLAHRLSYVLHHPLTIELLDHPTICVCHRCDNPRCVNPSHLFLGTMADNVKDRETKGRGNQAKGEKNRHAKLTETQVREIRGLWLDGGITQLELSNKYGILKPTINKIIRRKYWKHI
jgi:hypothetical protein